VKKYGNKDFSFLNTHVIWSTVDPKQIKVHLSESCPSLKRLGPRSDLSKTRTSLLTEKGKLGLNHEWKTGFLVLHCLQTSTMSCMSWLKYLLQMYMTFCFICCHMSLYICPVYFINNFNPFYAEFPN